MISSFFFKQNTRIFSAYNGRKMRISSLGRKNNILMPKSVTMAVKITIVNICFVNAVEYKHWGVHTSNPDRYSYAKKCNNGRENYNC